MSVSQMLAMFVCLVMNMAQAELLFVGDAMQHKAQIDAARQADGTYDYDKSFSEIAPIIMGADYAVANLETPIGTSNFTGYPCFNAPISFAKALHKAGFNMMLTANNHTLDRHGRGLRSTLNALDSIKADHIGTYRNSAERDSLIPYIKNINGFKIGFLNYTYGTNGITVNDGSIVNYIDRDIISKDINKLQRADAEIIVAAVHWGDEYKLKPNKAQRDLADFLIENGVDMVIGGHPHVVQPFEMRTSTATGRKALVVYSLGNFISNMKTRDTRGGAMVRVRLVRDAKGRACIDCASYDLVFTDVDDKGNFKVVPVTDNDIRLKSQRDAFVKATEANLNANNIGIARYNPSAKVSSLPVFAK